MPERLNEQLDEQGRIFLSQTNKNYFNFEKKEAKVSKIFDWFKDDFKKNAPSVLGVYQPLSAGRTGAKTARGREFIQGKINEVRLENGRIGRMNHSRLEN